MRVPARWSGVQGEANADCKFRDKIATVNFGRRAIHKGGKSSGVRRNSTFSRTPHRYADARVQEVLRVIGRWWKAWRRGSLDLPVRCCLF